MMMIAYDVPTTIVYIYKLGLQCCGPCIHTFALTFNAHMQKYIVVCIVQFVILLVLANVKRERERDLQSSIRSFACYAMPCILAYAEVSFCARSLSQFTLYTCSLARSFASDFFALFSVAFLHLKCVYVCNLNHLTMTMTMMIMNTEP